MLRERSGPSSTASGRGQDVLCKSKVKKYIKNITFCLGRTAVNRFIQITPGIHVPNTHPPNPRRQP